MTETPAPAAADGPPLSVLIHPCDCRDAMDLLMDEQSVQTCVTSPPYFGLRDYGTDGQIGLEPTPDEYVAQLVQVFRSVRRVLRDDGTVWLNLGDSYSNAGTRQGDRDGAVSDTTDDHRRVKGGYAPRVVGCKNKDLIGIPWRVAFALQADGWYLRQDIIWHKPNPMPESVRDRCTKAHEYLFLLSKSPRYYFDADAIKEQSVQSPQMFGRGGAKGTRGEQWYANASGAQRDNSGGYGTGGTRNKRSVWTVTPKPFKGAHFATMPPDLVRPCILAGSRPGDLVLDPFGGAGTTALVAQQEGRNAVLCELNTEYVAIARERLGL